MSLKITKVQHFREDQKFNAVQNFDREKISVQKAGKTINMYDAIQAANVDTDIYQTAIKYGMRGKEKECAQTYLQHNLAQLADEMQEMTDLRGILDRQIKAKNMWADLPLPIRQKFNNDINQFMDHGNDWITGLIEKQKAEMDKQKAEIAQVTEQPTTKE